MLTLGHADYARWPAARHTRLAITNDLLDNGLMQNTKTKFALGALTAVLMFVVGMSVGCNKNSGKAQNDSKSTQTKQSGPLPPEPLTMLVIGDEELGERTQRQWSARRDGTLTINNMDAQSFIDSGFQVSDDVDVVVYPPAMIGELAKLKRIQAVPRRLWESDEFNKNSLLRHFRMRICLLYTCPSPRDS